MNYTPAHGLIWGMFLGDSLALGPHWIYDTAEIARKFGRIEDLQAPGTSYHPGKKAGDQTHLGDQALVLFQSSRYQYRPEKFMRAWLSFWNDPKTVSYRDHATKDTLAHIDAGQPLLESGSDSSELAGAARSLLLVGLLDETGESRAADIKTVVNHAKLTHNSALSLETAALLAGLTYDVLKGVPLADAIQTNVNAHPSLAESLTAARAQLEKEPIAAIAALGQSCSLPGALAATFYLLMKYPLNPVEALIQNAQAGGDSAARGLVLGAILGGLHGFFVWPERWTANLSIAPLL